MSDWMDNKSIVWGIILSHNTSGCYCPELIGLIPKYKAIAIDGGPLPLALHPVREPTLRAFYQSRHFFVGH